MKKGSTSNGSAPGRNTSILAVISSLLQSLLNLMLPLCFAACRNILSASTAMPGTARHNRRLSMSVNAYPWTALSTTLAGPPVIQTEEQASLWQAQPWSGVVLSVTRRQPQQSPGTVARVVFEDPEFAVESFEDAANSRAHRVALDFARFVAVEFDTYDGS